MNDLAYTLPDNVQQLNVEGGPNLIHLHQLFPGKGESLDPKRKYYVGNPHDIVIDIPSNRQWYIHAIDVNYKADLKPYNPNTSPESQKSILSGWGVGAINEAYRIYYNRRTTPNTIAICPFLYLNGDDVVGYRLFKGHDTSQTGEVISRHYDQSGKYLGDVIPVEPYYAAMETRSVPRAGNVKEGVIKGTDVVTAVFLNKDGVPQSEAMLITVETNFTPSLNRPLKEVGSVSVVSPLLDPNDETTLVVPLHLPIQDISLKGIVHYTDGTSRPFDFDQTSGAIFGLEGRVLSRPDVVYDLSATYYLKENEFSHKEGIGARRHISFPLQLRTFVSDNANAVKLFVSPEWKGDQKGYQLTYWLLDLERNTPINVTSLVTYHKDYIYEPLRFNNVQRVIASVELEKVHPRYIPYVHTQEFDIVLLGKPVSHRDAFRIQYDEGNGFYGEGVEAMLIMEDQDHYLNISNGLTRWSQFIITHYQRLGPLSDLTAGVYAPDPTHVDVVHNGVKKRLDASNFYETFLFPESLASGNTVELHWLLKKGSSFLNLGVTPMVVKL